MEVSYCEFPQPCLQEILRRRDTYEFSEKKSIKMLLNELWKMLPCKNLQHFLRKSYFSIREASVFNINSSPFPGKEFFLLTNYIKGYNNFSSCFS